MATGRGRCVVVLSKLEKSLKWLGEVDDQIGLGWRNTHTDQLMP